MLINLHQPFVTINCDLVLQEYTALHYAVKHNELHCVKLLTQLGADVTITDYVSHYYVIANNM